MAETFPEAHIMKIGQDHYQKVLKGNYKISEIQSHCNKGQNETYIIEGKIE
jgi:hypothetical protein